MTVSRNEGIAFLVSSVIAGAMLFLAPQRHHYDYYVILRWITCGISGFGFYLSYKLELKITMWPLGFLAILFNPIIPVKLSKATWQPIDIIAGICLVACSQIILLKNRKDNNEQSNDD